MQNAKMRKCKMQNAKIKKATWVVDAQPPICSTPHLINHTFGLHEIDEIHEADQTGAKNSNGSKPLFWRD